MDDSKALLESNLTTWLPCRAVRAPITLYIKINQCRHPATEVLVNLTEAMGAHARCYPLLYGSQGCAWSRNLDPNFYPGRGLNLRPLTWQSSMQLLEHRTTHRMPVDQILLRHGSLMLFCL